MDSQVKSTSSLSVETNVSNEFSTSNKKNSSGTKGNFIKSGMPFTFSVPSPSMAGLTVAKLAARKFKKGAKKTTMQLRAELVAEKLKNELNNSIGSLSKLSGVLFNHEDDIPQVLRPTVEAVAAGIDSVEASIEAFKPSIEMLIYWENLTSGLFITFSVFAAWIFAILGFSILWVFLVVFVVNGAFKRNQARLRRKLMHNARIALAKTRLVDEKEAVEWLNIFLEKFWMQYEPTLSETIAASINWALEANKPTFLNDLRLSQFTLGSEAPRIESIRSYPRTTDDFLMMDLDISFQPFDEDDLSKRQKAFTNKKNSKIELVATVGKSIAVIPIPVLLTEIDCTGTMRIQIKFCTSFPHIEMIELGFLQRPALDFIIRPLKGVDLMDLPGLAPFISDTLNWVLDTSVVDPVTIKIPLLEWMSGTVEIDPVVAVLEINLRNGKTLKNTELTGKSDPYAKIFVGGNEVARTRRIDDTLDPVWNEVKYALVRQSNIESMDGSKADEFRIEIMDYNNISKDKHMGETSTLKISDWLKVLDEDLEPHIQNLEKEWGHPFETIEPVKHKLVSEKNVPNGGILTFCLSYHPIVEQNDIEPDIAISSGVLSVTIHQAKDVPAHSKSFNGFITCELNNGDRVAKTMTRKKSNAPVWEHKFDVFIMDVMSSKIKFVLSDEKDVGVNVFGSTTLQVSQVIKKKDTGNDWYALDDLKGKVRLSFKFKPVFLDNMSSHVNRHALGVARVCIKEAKGLLNVETFTKSDPYVAFSVDGHLVGKTHTIDNNLNPVWNETYYALIYSTSAKLNFEVFDYNNIMQHRKLGKSDLLFEDLTPNDSSVVDLPVKSPNVRNKSIARFEHQAALRKDGFKLEKRANETYCWCPLYFMGDNVSDSFWQNLHLKSQTDQPIKVKQKGHLHFSIEFFSTISEYLISPEQLDLVSSPVTLSHLSQKSQNADEISMINSIKDSPLRSNDPSDFKPVFSNDLQVKEIEIQEKLKIIQSIVAQNHTGILRVNIHDTKTLQRQGNLYCRMQLEGESEYNDTQVLRKTNEPIWNEINDMFVKHVRLAKLNITLWDAQNTKDKGDILIHTFEIPDLPSVIGHSHVWVKASENSSDGQMELRVSFGYIPVNLALDEAEFTSNQGSLQLEILHASNLESVDSNGLSDPYCVVLVNNKRVAKTQVQKKSLNPVFNELFTIPIESRQRSNIVLQIKDYNKLQKNIVIGTVTLPVTKLTPGSLFEDTFPLEGTSKGTLALRICFKSLQETCVKYAGSLTDSMESHNFPTFKAERSNSIATSLLSRSNSKIANTFSNPAGPHGNLKLSLESARNLKSVDSNGLSDPYIKVVYKYHGKWRTLHKTAIIKKTLNPMFDATKETIKIKFPPTQIRFIVKDYNLFGDSKDMGEADFDLTSIIDANPGRFEYAFDMWLPIGMGGSGEIHISGSIYISNDNDDTSSTNSYTSILPLKQVQKPMSPVKEISE